MSDPNEKSPNDEARKRPVIELENLHVRIGKREILRGLDAQVSGKAIGLLGPNGAGKTTLIHTLLGFITPSAGRASFRGPNLHDKRTSPIVGYMPEGDVYLSHMTGIRFVRYMGELSGLPAKTALERAHEALFFVGLGEARYREIGEYSTGMKQRIKLAQALVHGPSILILDEPTNALDPAARAHMLDLIRHIRAQPDVSILLSSHLLRDVEQSCDHVLILKGGRLIQECDLDAQRQSETGVLQVEVTGDVEPFAEGLASVARGVARINRGRFQLVMDPRQDSRALFALAAKTKCRIVRLQTRRDSLEDIFLRAMEDSSHPEEDRIT